VNCLSNTKLDNRVIRVDWDVGFSEGRQFGRGKNGVQWRDCFRENDDPERPEKPQFNPNHNQKNNYGDNNYGRGPYKKFKQYDEREMDGYKRVNFQFISFCFKINLEIE